jgi:hypothetical protein
MIVWMAPLFILTALSMVGELWNEKEDHIGTYVSLNVINLLGVFGFFYFRSDLFSYYHVHKAGGFRSAEDELECAEDDEDCEVVEDD